MADYAADAAALLDHVGWDSCRVVGMSFGGMVAQEFAVTFPERVERLALLCTSPGGARRRVVPAARARRSLDDAERAARLVAALDTRFTPEWLAEHPGRPGAGRHVRRRGADGDKPAEVRRGEAEQLEARRRHDVCDRLPRHHLPDAGGGGPLRRHRAAGQQRGHRVAHPRRRAAGLRGRPRLLRAGPVAFPDILDFLAADAPGR